MKEFLSIENRCTNISADNETEVFGKTKNKKRTGNKDMGMTGMRN